jgi:hypothetical protein
MNPGQTWQRLRTAECVAGALSVLGLAVLAGELDFPDEGPPLGSSETESRLRHVLTVAYANAVVKKVANLDTVPVGGTVRAFSPRN